MTQTSDIQRETLTLVEAAAALGISPRLAWKLANLGELPGCARLGHRLVVKKPALLAWLSERENATETTR